MGGSQWQEKLPLVPGSLERKSRGVRACLVGNLAHVWETANARLRRIFTNLGTGDAFETGRYHPDSDMER
jgi:hypothetical protein